MQSHLKKIDARIYLYEKDALVQKVAYVYEDGTEGEPLPRFIHLGMVTDSVLFGEECQIRFFVYPFSLRLYDTDVDSLEFINGSDRTISISCFGQEKLNRYEKELKTMGIEFTCSRTGKRRELLIVYDGNDDMTIETVCGKEPSQSPQTLATA